MSSKVSFIPLSRLFISRTIFVTTTINIHAELARVHKIDNNLTINSLELKFQYLYLLLNPKFH